MLPRLTHPGGASAAAPFVLLALGATWGGSFLFIEVLVDEVSPIEVAAGRLTFGAVAVAAFMLVRRIPLVLTPWLLVRMAALAGVANILPFALIGWGQEHIDSGVASVLNATMPIFAAVFGAAFLAEERFTAGRLAGLLLGFAGIVVLAGEDVFRITDSDVLGQLAVVAAAACYAVGSTYSRSLLRRYDPVSLSALQLTLGALLAWPLVPVLGGGTGYATASLEAWLSLLALGLAGTGIAYIAYLWLIEHTGSVRASLVTYIVPVVALVLGWAVLGETIGVNTIAGAALIVLGVATVMRGAAPAPAKDERLATASAVCD